jgi:hypothetical protein
MGVFLFSCYLHGDLQTGAVQPNVCMMLGSSSEREAVCRIYSSETIELLSMNQRDIPVKSVWDTLPAKSIDRLLEVKNLGNGVLLARTLLVSGGAPANVQVLNSSNKGNKTVTARQILLVAEPPIGVKVSPAKQESDGDDGQHIQCLIEDLPDSLTAEQMDLAAHILRRLPACSRKWPLIQAGTECFPTKSIQEITCLRSNLHGKIHMLIWVMLNIMCRRRCRVVLFEFQHWPGVQVFYLYPRKMGAIDSAWTYGMSVTKQTYPQPKIDTCRVFGVEPGATYI